VGHFSENRTSDHMRCAKPVQESYRFVESHSGKRGRAWGPMPEKKADVTMPTCASTLAYLRIWCTSMAWVLPLIPYIT